MLPKENIPPKSLCHFLNGLTFSSQEDSSSDAKAQLGVISVPMFKHFSKDKSLQLLISEAAMPLMDKYLSLIATYHWSGTSNQGSVFHATFSNTWKQMYPLFEEWFHNQLCDTCGKKHPTKYHNNLGARDDPTKRHRFKGNADCCSKRQWSNFQSKIRTATRSSLLLFIKLLLTSVSLMTLQVRVKMILCK